MPQDPSYQRPPAIAPDHRASQCLMSLAAHAFRVHLANRITGIRREQLADESDYAVAALAFSFSCQT